jgi:hypothetical protein
VIEHPLLDRVGIVPIRDVLEPAHRSAIRLRD